MKNYSYFEDAYDKSQFNLIKGRAEKCYGKGLGIDRIYKRDRFSDIFSNPEVCDFLVRYDKRKSKKEISGSSFKFKPFPKKYNTKRQWVDAELIVGDESFIAHGMRISKSKFSEHNYTGKQVLIPFRNLKQVVENKNHLGIFLFDEFGERNIFVPAKVMKRHYREHKKLNPERYKGSDKLRGGNGKREYLKVPTKDCLLFGEKCNSSKITKKFKTSIKLQGVYRNNNLNEFLPTDVVSRNTYVPSKDLVNF